MGGEEMNRRKEEYILPPFDLAAALPQGIPQISQIVEEGSLLTFDFRKCIGKIEESLPFLRVPRPIDFLYPHAYYYS